MSLRSPAEHENGGISHHVVLPATRHSRARGNPGLFSAELTWIPAFAGMTEPSGSWSLDGAQRNPGSSLYRSSSHRYFRRRHRGHRVRRHFFNQTIFTLRTPRLGGANSQPCFETVSQLSFRGNAEESRLRKWQKRRDPSLRSG